MRIPAFVVGLSALTLAAVAGYGTRGSLGLFIHPWQAQFGTTRASVSLVSSVGFITLAIGQPLAGRLLESYPARRVLVGGLLLSALGFSGAAFARDVWVAVVLAGAVAAFGGGLASLSALSYVAADLVERRHGAIFGVLTAAGAGGQVFVLPLAAVALEISLGTALLFFGLLLLAAAAAVAAFVPHVRPARELAPGEAARVPLARNARFWLLVVPFFICGYTTTGLIDVHLIPYAVDHHISETTASAALATLAAFNMLGVLVAGVVTDRADRGRLLAAIYTVRAVSLLVLPFLASPRAIFLFAVLFGLADFATVPPTTSLTRSLFGTGWATAIGLISAAHQVGSALGAYLGGWFYDQTGSYAYSFVSAAAALVVAALMSYALRESHTTGAAPALGTSRTA